MGGEILLRSGLLYLGVYYTMRNVYKYANSSKPWKIP